MAKTPEVMAPNDMGVVAVERQVKAQVQQLHGVAALLRDLALAQDKYALEYGKLPVSSAAALPSLASRAPLQRVVGALEAALTAAAQAHATLAVELSNTVAMPLEAFERQQKHQTRQLLTEIDDALQREKQLDQELAKALGGGVEPTDDNNHAEGGAGGPTDEPAFEARALRAKRDREREIVRQRLAELDLTDEQQAAILNGQLARCFDALARHARRVLTEVSDALEASSSQQRAAASDAADLTLEETVQVSQLHTDATSWMLALVGQLTPIEEAMVKRLQSLLKAHSLETITAVFAPSSQPQSSSSSAVATSPEFTTLWDLAQSHKQLTANLADPIGRTLRVSRQKQETIRKELVESMEETLRQLQAARSRVRDREAKLLQYLQQEAQQEAPPEQPTPLLGATGTDVLLSGSLRNAVVSWTKQLSSSPKKPLFKTKSASGASAFGVQSSPPKTTALSPPTPTSRFSAAKSPRRVNLESELADARAHLLTLEEREASQRDGMIKTLESTNHIGVKTMELMVTDYLKNVAKAMQLAATAAAKCSERLASTTGADAAGNKQDFNAFQRLVMFDDSDRRDDDLAKRLGLDEKTVTPETSASETETEEAEELSTASLAATLVSSESNSTSYSAMSSLQSELAVRERLCMVVGEMCKLHEHLQVTECTQQVVALAKRVVVVLWTGVRPFVRSVQRSPEQWQCVMALAIVLGLLSFVRRLDRMDDGWRGLVQLQDENARSLEQLVALVRE